MRTIVFTSLFAAALSACAPNFAHTRDEEADTVLGGEGRAPAEREANRAALMEIQSRETPQRPEAINDAPPVVVLRPERPSALDDNGALRRTAVDAFLAQGPHAVLGAAALAPARNGAGSVLGFRIESINADGAFLTAAGLQPGDVITKVNGQSIVLPDQFMDAWEAMDDADELRVEVLRDGEEMVLEWPIAEDADTDATASAR